LGLPELGNNNVEVDLPGCSNVKIAKLASNAQGQMVSNLFEIRIDPNDLGAFGKIFSTHLSFGQKIPVSQVRITSSAVRRVFKLTLFTTYLDFENCDCHRSR